MREFLGEKRAVWLVWRSLFGVLTLISFTAPAVPVEASDDLATIKVYIDERRVEPVEPTVNMAAGQSVLIDVLRSGQSVDPAKVMLAVEGEELGKGNRLLRFRRCVPELLATRERLQDSSVRDCPYVIGTPGGVEIFINDGVIGVRVATEADADHSAQSMHFAIEIVHRRHALVWSGGFSFFDLRDEEYRLDAIQGNAEQLRLTRTGDGEIPYKLAAFANYMGFPSKSFGISFGVATDVPIENLSAMLGVTASLRTLPLSDSIHITAGVAYSKREELAADFRGLTLVPAGTTQASLTDDRYDVGPFVAIGFNFFGDAGDKFKVVYSGTK